MIESGEIDERSYCFGAFRLYPAQRLLLRGDKEERVGQRVLSVLHFMVANPGRILPYDEIIAGACHGVSIDLRTLWTHVNNVRRIVGTDAIVTINNQGYQFILPVTQEDATLPVATKAIAASTTLPRGRIDDASRDVELAEIEGLVAQNRLVTVLGPGGVGKTWLAVQLGWRLSENFLQGVHLVDLAPVNQAAAVASTTGRVLRIGMRGGVAPIDAIAAWIGARPMVLILDNCEHVVAAAADLILTLLERAPNLSIIATSQERLDLPQEKFYELLPLTLPAAAKLFAQRAAAADPRFLFGADHEAAVAEICQGLDRLPLALEMAASLMRVLGLKGIKAGLAQRFRMLKSGPRLAKDSHSSLSKMVEWSHGLLDAADQAVFRRLAIFSGSFSLDAAAAIACGADGDRWTATDSLHRLVEKSLLCSDDGEIRRYHLLETLRLYGRDRLDEHGELGEIAERHAQYFRALLEQADSAWETTPDSEWLALYGPDIDNIRTALEWALAKKERAHTAIALAGITDRLWMRLGQIPEGRRYIDQVVALIDDKTPQIDAARALMSAGILWREADRRRAVAMMERSATLYRQMGDRHRLGVVLDQIGGNYVYFGRHDEAKAALAEAEAILSTGGGAKSLIGVLNGFGSLALITDDIDGARQHYYAARNLARIWKDSVRENIALINLGELEFRVGEIGRAIEYAREAVRGLRSAKERSYLASPLVNLTAYLILLGDHAEARSHAAEALSLLREEGGHWLRLCLQTWALLAAFRGKQAEAAQLIGFVSSDYERSGETREPLELKIYEYLQTVLATSLTPVDIEFWATEGARWTEEHAVDYALSRIVSTDESSVDIRG